VIVCLRTVVVPPEWHERYLAWIADGRAIRQQHGILAELVCEPAEPGGDTVVITVWPSHEVFDAWIATPHRDALTARRSTRPSPTGRSPGTRSPADTSTCPA
jgi:heme-degrading monooxygenase HmoA